MPVAKLPRDGQSCVRSTAWRFDEQHIRAGFRIQPGALDGRSKPSTATASVRAIIRVSLPHAHRSPP